MAIIRIIESSSFCCGKNIEKKNEDAILSPRYVQNGLLLAVADGVGSYQGSDLASMCAIEYLESLTNVSDALQSDIIFSDILGRIIDLSENNLEYEKASTTLTFLFVHNDQLHIGHIGDCRAYAKVGNKLKQLTKDHTKHQELMDEKIFTKKQLKNVKGKNIITTAISQVVSMKYDVTSIPLCELVNNDRTIMLYIMSDGSHEHWERNPRFSLNTMSSSIKFGNALQRRIERYGPTDDFSFVGVKIKL
ncbi:PP2C family protein-serine/threonine phosphatase [Photobacterium phosphoreum]|uniref:PP2C family protein-serine/threonine phosphatase n=1 Tax=Photobacterium phosphoreum TaxID=659 RepID=UPI0024BA302D|nr:PP2C family serine/threonine-protein phosphatase [Photobacterium phosphoreum]